MLGELAGVKGTEVLLAAVEKSIGPPSKLTGNGRNLEATLALLVEARRGRASDVRASTIVRAATRCIHTVSMIGMSLTCSFDIIRTYLYSQIICLISTVSSHGPACTLTKHNHQSFFTIHMEHYCRAKLACTHPRACTLPSLTYLACSDLCLFRHENDQPVDNEITYGTSRHARQGQQIPKNNHTDTELLMFGQRAGHPTFSADRHAAALNVRMPRFAGEAELWTTFYQISTYRHRCRYTSLQTVIGIRHADQ